ncbi:MULTISPECIES: hypothetical protein [Brevibacillus]|uniref:hypothetical protein n=1 Tax=Brevibacillus TaxID=55080 RepID=UPI001606DD4B|nr:MULTISPECIES: hypothetical protein [Brevibacillus]MCM3081955.1 hypothetical protein [Brevibacillus invocatus]MCM3432361.1 hypothetical protein [Brevibacillus invocatus]MDH4618978.1 hypothetical protein [Brevibacillus sp. AY1]
MSQFEAGTFLAYLAFSIFFLVAYKLQQISLFALVMLLVATAVVIGIFYTLVMQYWYA